MFSYQSRCIFGLLLIMHVEGSLQDSVNNTVCSKKPVLLHNIKPKYYLDMGEVLQVWVKIVHEPWQDNRLIGGVSDPVVLSFNLTSFQHTTEFIGVLTRNLTATIFQHPGHVSQLLMNRANYSGEVEFHVKTFSENEDCNAEVSTSISVGCSPNKNLQIGGQKYKECEEFKNFNYTIASDQLTEGKSKVVNYDFKSLGCPIHSESSNSFKPIVYLYDGDELVKEVTNNFIMWEKNGRNSHHYSHTMEQVGCLKASQSWTEMLDSKNDEADIDQAWTQQNFQSCFERDESTGKASLEKPYEILNSTGGSALMWDDIGIFVFKLRVIDPNASYCDLTTEFAIIVTDMKTSDKEIPTFVVLGTSCFGIILGCTVAFYINIYCSGY